MDFDNLHNIYADSEEQYLKATILYANSENSLFADKEFTKPIDGDTLTRLFLIDAAIVHDVSTGTYYRPFACVKDSEGVKITVVDSNGTVQYSA